MAPRWKGKEAEAKAIASPMSSLVSQLQSSLLESNAQGLLSGCNVLLAAHPEQIELFISACFGCPYGTVVMDNQHWFELSFEEALYLCSVLKCIKIVGEAERAINEEELWDYMTSKRVGFPILFKAYSHLRSKNWVVRMGFQYGVDFVAYRHRPALVHSEYAVLALSDDNESANARLKVWSDYHCTLRVGGSVAKTLLVLHISRNGYDSSSISCLEHYSVQERIVTRWNPERSRQNPTVADKESRKSST